MASEKIVRTRARVFAGEGIAKHQFSVTGKVVKVWDNVAGHYTTCHSMSKATIARILKLAKQDA